MQDTHPRHSHQNGIVQIISYSRQGFISPHATNVKILSESCAAAVNNISCACRNGSVTPGNALVAFFGLRQFDFAYRCNFQSINFHFASDSSKNHGSRLVCQTLHLSYRCQSFDAHTAPNFYRHRFIARCFSIFFLPLIFLSLQAPLALCVRQPCRFSQCFAGCFFRFLLHTLFVACPAFLNLTHFLLYHFVTGFSIYVSNLHLKHVQFLTCFACSLLLSLTLTNFADSIFYFAIALAEQFLCLLFCSPEDFLSFAFYLFYALLVVGYASFQ